MLMLSIIENGEEPLVFLVMTIFGECIQLKFRQIISENHILVSVLCSRMRFAQQYLCKYWAKPHVRLNGFDGLVWEVMALVYSETAGHSSIIFVKLQNYEKILGLVIISSMLNHCSSPQTSYISNNQFGLIKETYWDIAFQSSLVYS